MSVFETTLFKKLKTIWYQKLKESGFEDQENPETNRLFKCHSYFFKDYYKESRYGSIGILQKRSYYEDAAYFLHSYDFENETQKEIWALHSEAISIRDISKKLSLEHHFVHKTINSLKGKMKLEL